VNSISDPSSETGGVSAPAVGDKRSLYTLSLLRNTGLDVLWVLVPFGGAYASSSSSRRSVLHLVDFFAVGFFGPKFLAFLVALEFNRFFFFFFFIFAGSFRFLLELLLCFRRALVDTSGKALVSLGVLFVFL